jgi:chorismate-pyruvate lyase
MKASLRARRSLKELWNLFPQNGLGPLPGCRLVAAREVPPPFHGLLVHHQHMTRTLEKHHRAAMVLRVLERCREGEIYARRIILNAMTTGRPALVGIMRIDLECTPPAVREAILSESAPLGSILIAHRVLRRIEPFAYLKIAPSAPMVKLLRISPSQPAYGRLATIHCGGLPAVDLLEVVAP